MQNAAAALSSVWVAHPKQKIEQECRSRSHLSQRVRVSLRCLMAACWLPISCDLSMQAELSCATSACRVCVVSCCLLRVSCSCWTSALSESSRSFLELHFLPCFPWRDCKPSCIVCLQCHMSVGNFRQSSMLDVDQMAQAVCTDVLPPLVILDHKI